MAQMKKRLEKLEKQKKSLSENTVSIRLVGVIRNAEGQLVQIDDGYEQTLND